MLALERRGGEDGPKAGRRRVRAGGDDGLKSLGIGVRDIVLVFGEFIRQGWSILMAGYKAELSSAL